MKNNSNLVLNKTSILNINYKKNEGSSFKNNNIIYKKDNFNATKDSSKSEPYFKNLFYGKTSSKATVVAAMSNQKSDIAMLCPRDLVGKSLKPAAFDQFQKALKFDHLGKVTGLRSAAKKLTNDELNSLNSAIISDLTKTNSVGERDTARTNREIVLDLICELNKNIKINDPNSEKINLIKEYLQSLKSIWLSPEIGSTATEKLLHQASNKLKKDFPDLSKKFRELSIEASKPKFFTQKHDNNFGRKFESEFVFSLVKNPPESVLIAADKTGKFVANYFTNSTECSNFPNRFFELASLIESDQRPWHSELPEIRDFIKDPSEENFKKMMENSNRTGYSVIKQSYLGVKISLTVQGPWMDEANNNYFGVITPARSTTPSVLGDIVKRTPKLIANFQKKINSDQSIKKNGREQLQQVNSILRKLNFDPHQKNVKKAFLKINKILGQDFPALIISVDDILKSLAEIGPDASLEMVSQALTNDDRARLNKNFAWPVQLKTDGFGTRLPHQLPNQRGANWGSGKNIQASVHVNVDKPTKFEEHALMNDQNTVNGASGSTNIMTFLYKHMQDEAAKSGEELINMTDAFAGTMMFLTFDGGHSLPESFGTFNAIVSSANSGGADSVQQNNFDSVKKFRWEALNTFSLDYREISKVFGSKDTAQSMQAAIDAAFEITRDLFADVHAQRRGSDISQNGAGESEEGRS